MHDNLASCALFFVAGGVLRQLAVAAQRSCGLPEPAVLAAIFKTSRLEGGNKAVAVYVECGTQFVERCVLVSQLHVDKAEEHHGVRWNVGHNVDDVSEFPHAGELCQCACISLWLK